MISEYVYQLIESTQNKLDVAPWRLNDMDAGLLVRYLRNLVEDYEELDKQYHELLRQTSQHNRDMVGLMFKATLDGVLGKENTNRD